MHTMSPSIQRSDNETVPQLYEVLEVECHIGVKALEGLSPCELDEILVDILSNHLIQFLLRRQKVTRIIQGVPERRQAIIRVANKLK